MRDGGATSRVVVLDPEPLHAKLVQLVLTDGGHEVVIADGPAMVLAEVTGREVYGVVLEVDLPDISGFQLCTEMRSRGYNGPVVFVTRHHETLPARQSAFECGGDDLLAKPFDPLELRLRIESIARRSAQADRLLTGSVVRVGDAELRVREMTFSVEGRPPAYLTPTEMRLLECLMRNSPRTILRDTLIDRAWPNDFIADSNRVDVYVGRLRRKIQRNPLHAPYIHTVRGVGYAFRAAEGRVVPLRVEQASDGVMTSR
jgi:DNA-binding response OmpR family regulator